VKIVPVPSAKALDALFDRVAAILEAGREQVLHSVNHATIHAYWHIGREIVMALQEGNPRASYGNTLIDGLSERLTHRYGQGYSSTNLRYFRQFYQTYPSRKHHPVGDGSGSNNSIQIHHPAGDESRLAFHPNLGWSQYRTLIKVKESKAREFYEAEAGRANWSRRDLERQINSLFFERLLASTDKESMLAQVRTDSAKVRPIDMLKDPYVLEFLDLPASAQLHEQQLEQAIIDQLQRFLLELGRGFSFVARQQRMRFDDKDFFVDLVFYNYLLKCFVLIDLKIGELTHQDIGQMDGYVRMYEVQHKITGDNPTIGLILCSEKNDAVARYSVLSDSQQLFASRYRLTLPTEQELQIALQRQRALVENQIDSAHP
jgi:predicted nuclease of restriction endonuclease-like (RecB) superfamily